MQRRTLDLIFAIGGTLLAALLVVLGLVLQSQASFADDYVSEQLAAQQITFTPAEHLSDEEREADCLVDYAGQLLTTGPMAECYANEYIGLHVAGVNDGKTYSQTSGEARAASSAAAELLEADPEDPEGLELQAEADELAGKVETLFRGETLRGLLLTTYGFSTLGERAGQAAMVCFAVAGVLLLASIGAWVHERSTPRDERIEV